MSDESQLTPEARSEIDAYLRKQIGRWGVILGIVNGAAIAGAVLYAFFVLPEQAVNKASDRMNTLLEKMIDRTINHVHEVTIEAAESKAAIIAANQEAAAFRKKLDTYESALERAHTLQKSCEDLSNRLEATIKRPAHMLSNAAALVEKDTGFADFVTAAPLIKSRGDTVRVPVLQADAVIVSGAIISGEDSVVINVGAKACPTSKCDCPPGYEGFPLDLNSGARGDYVILCVKRSGAPKG